MTCWTGCATSVVAPGDAPVDPIVRLEVHAQMHLQVDQTVPEATAPVMAPVATRPEMGPAVGAPRVAPARMEGVTAAVMGGVTMVRTTTVAIAGTTAVSRWWPKVQPGLHGRA